MSTEKKFDESRRGWRARVRTIPAGCPSAGSVKELNLPSICATDLSNEPIRNSFSWPCFGIALRRFQLWHQPRCGPSDCRGKAVGDWQPDRDLLVWTNPYRCGGT